MFQNFLNYFVLIALYIATKPNPTESEQSEISAVNSLLGDPNMLSVINNLSVEGYIDEQGNLTSYGLTTVKKFGEKPRNARQINFDRIFKNCTPGYAMAAMFTAETRLNELCNNGIMKMATPETVDSLMDAGIRLQSWAEYFDNIGVPDDNTSRITVEEPVVAGEGEE